jgi:hypothetical protein
MIFPGNFITTFPKTKSPIEGALPPGLSFWRGGTLGFFLISFTVALEKLILVGVE